MEASRSCGESKIAISHWLDPWLIQQLALPYYIEKKLNTVYPILYKPTLKNSIN